VLQREATLSHGSYTHPSMRRGSIKQPQLPLPMPRKTERLCALWARCIHGTTNRHCLCCAVVSFRLARTSHSSKAKEEQITFAEFELGGILGSCLCLQSAHRETVPQRATLAVFAKPADVRMLFLSSSDNLLTVRSCSGLGAPEGTARAH
jgi:hypothetical protein